MTAFLSSFLDFLNPIPHVLDGFWSFNAFLKLFVQGVKSAVPFSTKCFPPLISTSIFDGGVPAPGHSPSGERRKDKRIGRSPP